MPLHDTGMEERFEHLTRLIQDRVEDLFITKQLTCSEAVLSVLNNSLDGGLSPEMAVRLGSGLSEGFGGSGCTCGALSGGTVALGLFLGRNGPGLLNGRSIRAASKKMHDQFKDHFGSTCCRVLTKNLMRGSRDHFELCGKRTGWVAGKTAALILERHPEIRFKADRRYLKAHDSAVNINRKKLPGVIRG